MNNHDIDIELPSSDEAAAHMLPSDLKKFEFGEHVAEAFSIAVGNPDETSRPLFTLDQVRAAIESYIKRTNQADGEHTIKIGDVTVVAYGPQGSGKTRVLDQIQEMLTSTVQTVIEIDMPAEFRSGNDIPVTQATIKRERMEEIIRDAIAKATGEDK